MSEIKFGTDGWRAIMARDFTFENCRVVAQGIAGYVNNQQLTKKGIVIGYDHRFMSEDFARECARVLLGNGIKTFLLCKAAPTPVTAFAVRLKQAGGAIMITASHNPPEYNGIKFIPEYAGPALPDVTDAIETEISHVLESHKIYELSIEDAAQFDLFEEIDVDREYCHQVTNLLLPKSFEKNLIKITIDPMFGAGCGYLDKILTGLGCEVRTINNYRDPLFGGSLPEPTDENMSDLKRAVSSYNSDLGLALDGDADRFGIIDNEGNFVSANQFLSLLLEHLLTTRTFRGPVARSLATTHMLDRIAQQNGITVIETPVGFKYVGEGLREKGCILGGEESGGLSIFGHIPEKDGILACLLAAEMLAGTGKSFARLTEELNKKYGSWDSRRLDIKVKPEEKENILSKITEYKPKSILGIGVQSVSSREGLKIVLEDGSWILVRASGTEPMFRLYVESTNLDRIREIQAEVSSAIALK